MELYIPPERPQRNLLNGRFLKGCTPHNKGKEMKFHSDNTKQRCINNLLKGRGGWHKTGAWMNRKSVVLIKDGKLRGVFPSIREASEAIGVSPALISAICRKVRGRHTAKGYKCFYEHDDWCNLIE